MTRTVRIRIIGIPKNGIPGLDVPPYIMAAWEGVEIESLGRRDKTDEDVLVGREVTEGYEFMGSKALEALRLYGKIEAHNWWVEHYPEIKGAKITFAKNVCKPLE